MIVSRAHCLQAVSPDFRPRLFVARGVYPFPKSPQRKPEGLRVVVATGFHPETAVPTELAVWERNAGRDGWADCRLRDHHG